MPPHSVCRSSPRVQIEEGGAPALEPYGGSPPLAYAGYAFLRDDEQGAYVGKDLLLRSLVSLLAMGGAIISALAWRNVGKNAELQIRLVRASELNTRGFRDKRADPEPESSKPGAPVNPNNPMQNTNLPLT